MCRSVFIASLVLLAAVAPVSAAAQSGGDSMQIVIASGPHAGTYDLSPANMMCMKSKARSQFSAAYKDLQAHAANAVSGVGLNVSNPDTPGPKSGEINITFGDPEETGDFTFEAQVPDKGKHLFAYIVSGKAVMVSFDGQASDGTKLRVTARCADPMMF